MKSSYIWDTLANEKYTILIGASISTSAKVNREQPSFQKSEKTGNQG